MALEIKELKIKIDVVDKSRSRTAANTNLPLDAKKLKKEILAECLAKVTEMLTETLER